MSASPLEDRLREVLTEHSAGRQAPTDLAERAEYRGRRARRRRRTAGVAVASAAVAATAVLGTGLTAPEPADRADRTGRVAAAPGPATPVPESPGTLPYLRTPGKGTCMTIRLRSTKERTINRIALADCPKQEVKRLAERISENCPELDDIDTRTEGQVVITGDVEELRCAGKALGIASSRFPLP